MVARRLPLPTWEPVQTSCRSMTTNLSCIKPSRRSPRMGISAA